MSEHTAMQEDIRELRTRAELAERDLATLKANIRGVIGTASAEGTVVSDAGDWLTVVRVYAEALEAIGGLVDATPPPVTRS